MSSRFVVGVAVSCFFLGFTAGAATVLYVAFRVLMRSSNLNYGATTTITTRATAAAGEPKRKSNVYILPKVDDTDENGNPAHPLAPTAPRVVEETVMWLNMLFQKIFNDVIKSEEARDLFVSKVESIVNEKFEEHKRENKEESWIERELEKAIEKSKIEVDDLTFSETLPSITAIRTHRLDGEERSSGNGNSNFMVEVDYHYVGHMSVSGKTVLHFLPSQDGKMAFNFPVHVRLILERAIGSVRIFFLTSTEESHLTRVFWVLPESPQLTFKVEPLTLFEGNSVSASADLLAASIRQKLIPSLSRSITQKFTTFVTKEYVWPHNNSEDMFEMLGLGHLHSMADGAPLRRSIEARMLQQLFNTFYPQWMEEYRSSGSESSSSSSNMIIGSNRNGSGSAGEGSGGNLRRLHRKNDLSDWHVLEKDDEQSPPPPPPQPPQPPQSQQSQHTQLKNLIMERWNGFVNNNLK